MKYPRLTDSDKNYGPLTVGKCTSSFTFYFQYSSSHDNEDNETKANTLTVYLGRWAFRLGLPPIVKSFKIKVMAPNWNEETVKRIGRNWYYNYFPRNYGISLMDSHLSIYYGVQGDDLPKGVKEKRIGFFLPWSERRLIKHQIFDGDDNLVWSDSFKGNSRTRYEESSRVIETLKKQVYSVRDYDDSLVEMTVYSTYMEFARGTGWFKWLSWFTKNIKRRSIDISFNKAVGRRKDSWKGGLFGTGATMKENETTSQAVLRVFQEKDTTVNEFKDITLVSRIS